MFTRELKMLFVVFLSGLCVFFVWNYFETKFLGTDRQEEYVIPGKIEILYKPQELVVLFSRGKKGN
ncbi:hypothetical protein KA001_00220 [Patescibacteria group bacterium]|nr:hypothetical protein [Patescibacteria group bacterium]